MKRLLVLVSICCFFMSCSSQKIVVNRKIINTEGEPMLIGRITPEALTTPDFNNWFSKEYNAYVPNKNIIKKLKNRARLCNIEIFLGTWSSESQEQLPRFLKIIHELKIPEKKIALYALNRNNESFYGEQSQKNIREIPVFIIYKGKNEVGRIVESPSHETLEEDLYKIIIKKEYSN